MATHHQVGKYISANSYFKLQLMPSCSIHQPGIGLLKYYCKRFTSPPSSPQATLHIWHLHSFVSYFPPQLNLLLEAQRRSSKQMLGQLEEVSRSHSGALHRLEEQERRNRAFKHKNNCFTTLLEQDRGRLVHQTLEALMNAKEKNNIG